ncbi:thioesterase II family protein [Streptomyces nanhaiensis]|uniref:thioesterase II family protein n=1 Tax=Streptomyces nanhaiensis TaxID=679319 RepID=UPI00399D31C9
MHLNRTTRTVTGPGRGEEERRRWLRPLGGRGPGSGGGQRVRLVCFPHAGGAAGSFRPFAPLLPGGVDLLAVQYPGRHDRTGEPCATRMDELAGPLAAALAPVSGDGLVLLGHSMGAAVAAEVAARLEEHTGRPLLRLFVSGRPAPGTRDPVSVHEGGDEALLADLKRLGGTDEALFSDPALQSLVLPSLRADYRLIETYRPPEGRRLRTPVTALTGDNDPEVTPEEAEAWRSCSSGPFRLHVFPGGHFYLLERPVAVLGAVLADLGRGAPAGLEWPSTP